MLVGIWIKPVPYRWLTPFNEWRHLLEFFGVVVAFTTSLYLVNTFSFSQTHNDPKKFQVNVKSWEPDGSPILITTAIITFLFLCTVTHSWQAKMGTVNLQELQKAFPKHAMEQKQQKEQIWEERTDIICHFGLAWARAWKRLDECFSLHWHGCRDVLPQMGCFWILTHTFSQVIFSPSS